MTKTKTGILTGACLLALATWSSAEAATCRPRVVGEGTGQGVAGRGTEVARSRAEASWSAAAQARYGSSFAIFGKARGVRYDCKKNAIIQAKCVVSAQPCR